MAHDIDIEAGVIPVLDKRAEDALIRRVARLQSKISSGVSSKASEELAALTRDYTATMVATGRAATSTSARIMLEKKANITNAFAKAATRQGSDEGKIALREGRVSLYKPISKADIARMSTQNAAIATNWNDVLGKYFEIKDKPSATDQSGLIKQLTEITTAVKGIGKNQPKALKSIEKDAKNMTKEVAGWRATQRAGVAGMGAFSSSIKQLFDWALRAFSVQKIFTTAQTGIERGEKGWIESAMYGANRDVALDRTYANLLQMDEKAFADVQRKVLTYRERLKWRQVSSSENYMWARLGLLPLVSSGQAAENPRAFMNTFFGALRNRPETEALSALQSGGLDASLIYAARTLPSISQTKQQEVYQDYLKRVADEQYAHMETLPARGWWGRRGADITAGLSMAAANFMTSGLSAKNFQYLADTLKGITYENYKPVNRAIVEGRNPTWLEKAISTPVFGPVIEDKAKGIEPVQKGVQYVTNYVTQNITGADSDDIAEKTVEHLNMLNLNSTVKAKTTAR